MVADDQCHILKLTSIEVKCQVRKVSYQHFRSNGVDNHVKHIKCADFNLLVVVSLFLICPS